MHSSNRSRSARPARCAGFTLVELLVVIAIIGVLVALLLPAVLSTRNSALRIQCVNNLRQVGLGLNIYHGAHNEFPPGGVEWRAHENHTARQLAWSAYLLPFIEEQAVYERLDLETPFDSEENADAASSMLSVYICPVSLRGAQLVDGRGPCDYGGIYGERITSRNDPPKGTMLYDQPIRIREITDGTSHTLIVAEDSQFRDGQWINGRNIFDQAFAINQAPNFENDIRSQHRGGANAVCADGSVHFLVDTTDLTLLAGLCTRAGGEVANR
jgi:prepilin-type N-terminal cleavage/methylation domain-containing protein